MAEQISYQGYAQAEGFRPIQVSDANVARIGQEGQRIIRGMEEQRQADIKNRTDYLQGLKYKNQLEAEARDRNEQMRRGNVADIQERKFDNIEREIQANYTNQQNIYKSISSLSTKAFELANTIEEEKYKRIYTDTMNKLIINGGDPAKSIAYDSQYNQLQQAGVAINTIADQLRAAGADAETEEKVRRRAHPAELEAEKRYNAFRAAKQWDGWIQQKLQTDSETQIVVPGPNGEAIKLTPITASTAAEKAAVVRALIPEYLQEMKLWGESPALLAQPLAEMNTINEGIIADARKSEIKASVDKRVNTATDAFADLRTPETFFGAFNTLTSANGGDRGAARTQLFQLMFTAKDDNGNPLFSDVERQKILDQTFPGQDKTIGDQYSTQIAELRDEARNQANQQYRQTEATKQREFAEKADQARSDIEQSIAEGTYDNSDAEFLYELFRQKGNEIGMKMVTSYMKFTNESVNDEGYLEKWQDAAVVGALTIRDVTTAYGKVSNETLRKGIELAKTSEAAAVPEDIKATADAFIKSKITNDVAFDFLTKQGNETAPLVLADAQARFNKEFVLKMRETDNPIEARDYALGVLENEFENPNGRYVVETPMGTADQKLTSYYKNFKIKAQLPSRDTLRKTLAENPDALDTQELIKPEIIRNTLKNFNKTGRVELPRMAQDIANETGGQYSALDIFNRQVKRLGEKEIPLKALEKAQNTIDSRFQRYVNYQPNQIRTDVSLLGSGMPSIYNNPQITNEQRSALNVLAKYESGAAGYNAVNQIGVNDGRGVLGFSGDFRKMRQHGGKSLTDMTVGEVMALQADNNMSNDEWIASGRLHAVGKYQFIGPTLAAWVKRLGIPPETRFSPEVQDTLALAYMKTAGIGPWVGPSDKATAEERAMIERARMQPISFGTSVWRQTSNMNPNLVSRLTGGN